MPLTRRALLEESLAFGAGTVVSLRDLGGALNCLVAPGDTLAFTHVTVIDATGGQPLTIAQSLFKAIGSRRSARLTS
jgi:hypothetical protein